MFLIVPKRPAMSTASPRRSLQLAVAWLVAALLAGCSNPGPELVPVPVPDMTALEPSVRTAVAREHANVDRVTAGKPTNAELAAAYGELAMTYHAQRLVPAAEAAYTNARLLAPDDKRWHYLLGQLYNDSSRTEKALQAFEAALASDGKDVPILYSLGDAYLKHGDYGKAQTTYQKLESLPQARAAALTGLGKVALAQHQYKEAAQYLEAALNLEPGATRLRQPLAMAYQALGDRARAERNIAQYAPDGQEPEIPDPMADALASKIASSGALLRRGERAGKAGRLDLAEQAFRAAIAADPRNAEAAANLGITLANLGRLEEAQRSLEQSLALDDRSAIAHLSLGVVMDRQGNDQAAIDQYAASLAQDPINTQAMVYLGDAKLRVGQTIDAARFYKQALERVPNSSRLHLSLAFAYVKATRYADARQTLEAALKAQPDNPEIVNALARLLATAPVASARDGARALELAKRLFEATKDPDAGQSYAMALAETGRFNEAIVLQRETITVLAHTGREYQKPFLEANLALYTSHKPSRAGWPPDDPLLMPRSPATRLARS